MGEPLDRAGLLTRYLHWQPKIEQVTLPDGGSVFVRELDAGALDNWEIGNIGYDAKFNVVRNPNPRARLVARCLCDSAGKRLFNDEEAGVIAGFPAAVVDAIHQVAVRLNGIRGQEDKEKNSSSRAAPGDSSSGSPDTLAEPSQS